jgi:murein DD-endopeptidase MepM/ murein hydrolase activator NlpD
MQRSLAIAAVLAALSAPGVARATATPVAEQQEPAWFGAAALQLAHVAANLELPVPHELVDRFLQWELRVRDLFHASIDQLASIAAHVPSATPDLAILTTSPIPDSLSSGFGWRDDPIRHDRRFHGGTDFKADPGTPVLAAGDGVVVFAGRQGGYGNVIYVDHGGGVITRYGHLRRIETKRDAVVAAGERIGQVGSTGRATGPHLHFEVRLDGRAVDPVTAMTVAELSRTSPTLGHLASFALAPEIQSHRRAANDHQQRSEIHESRPGRAKRPQVLW